uniref:12-(S)-hydroxy-5,8,10,14-eicosatetraenoic acid receptor n=1 Tax=Jaculus jaculus TaxID=51337 RepID=UPI001E1AFDEB
LRVGCSSLAWVLCVTRLLGLLVALNQYLHEVHPRLRVHLLSPKAARVTLCLIWLMMLALMPHSLLILEAYQNSTCCPNLCLVEEACASTPWQEWPGWSPGAYLPGARSCDAQQATVHVCNIAGSLTCEPSPLQPGRHPLIPQSVQHLRQEGAAESPSSDLRNSYT